MATIVTREGKGSALSWDEMDDNFTNLNTDKAELASPALTGTPTAPTASPGTNTTQIATTGFVTTADNLKANLASPAFTGTPTAPTAAAGTSTTQLATCAFVTATSFISALPGQSGNAGKTIKTNGTNASWAAPLEWTVVAANTNCVAFTAYAVNTDSGAYEMTLPASPTANDTCYFMDAGNNAATNNITIKRNASGETIMELSEDMSVTTNGATFALQYVNSSWRLA